MKSNSAQYTAVAIILHWVIAIAILVNLGLGLWMHEAIHGEDSRALAIAGYQWHKSIGLAVLVLSILRLAWRFLFPPPLLPAHMGAAARALARFTHGAFYLLMIGIPLTGWLYVSAQWREDAPLNVPTLWFGLFEVPHLFGFNEAAQPVRQQLSGAAAEAHELLAFSLLALFFLHVAAALQHQFVKGDGVLARMLPWLQSPERAMPPMTPSRPVAALVVVLTAGGLLAYATSARLYNGEKLGGAPEMTAVLSAMQDESAASAPLWEVLPAGSEIGFIGRHAGQEFRGRFTSWLSEIRFDPANLENSSVLAVINTASATDGVPLHDRTLPEDEWFDVANHPYATFRATEIRALSQDRFEVLGTLTIKRRSIALPPMTMMFTGDALEITGDAAVDRADFDLGMASDPEGEYVSRSIRIPVSIIASPVQSAGQPGS